MRGDSPWKEQGECLCKEQGLPVHLSQHEGEACISRI